MFNDNNKNIAESLRQETQRASQTFKVMKSMLSDFEGRLLSGTHDID